MSRRVAVITVFSAILAVVFAALPAGAQPSGEIQAKRGEIGEAQDRLARLQSEVSASYESYTGAVSELKELNRGIGATTEELMEAEKRLIEAESDLEAQAARVYKSGNVGFVDVLVGVDSFAEFATRVDLWMRVLEEQQAEVERVRQVREELAGKQDALEAKREKRSAAVEEAAARRDEAARLEAEAQAYLGSLNGELQGMIQAQLFAEGEARERQQQVLEARRLELAEAIERQAELAAERAAAQQAAAEKAAAERAAAEREAELAAQRAEEERAAEQAAAERAAQREAAEKAAEQRAAERAAVEEAQRQAELAAQRAEEKRLAEQQEAAAAKLAQQQAAAERKAAEKAAAVQQETAAETPEVQQAPAETTPKQRVNTEDRYVNDQGGAQAPQQPPQQQAPQQQAPQQQAPQQQTPSQPPSSGGTGDLSGSSSTHPNYPWQPHVAQVANDVEARFGVTPTSYDGHSPSGDLAIDFMVGSDKALGDQVADYLASNADAFKVDYIIWYGRFFSVWPNYWGPAYTWNANGDGEHYDHVHVSFKP